MRTLRGILAAALAGILATAGTPPAPKAAPERVIIRLADRSARLSLMAAVRGPGMTLDVRHARVIQGLRSIHATRSSISPGLSFFPKAGMRVGGRPWTMACRRKAGDAAASSSAL